MSRIIDQRYEIMMVVNLITLFVAAILWLIHDAQSHGKSFWLAVLLIVVFQVPGFFFWLAYRRSRKRDSDALGANPPGVTSES